jgi:hypothetical protein
MKVELENKKTGARQAFPFSQAEGILRYEKQIKAECWIIPTDSKYIFNGNFITSRILKADPEPEKPKRNPKGSGKKNSSQATFPTGNGE